MQNDGIGPWGRFGGVYISHRARGTLLPGSPISINVCNIELALSSKFYPGRYAFLGNAPGRLASLFEGKRIISYCVAPGDWAAHTQRLENHRTWTDVAHALSHDQANDDSHLNAVWQRGRESIGRYRYIDEFEKIAVQTWDKEHAKKYIDRVVGLARLIRAQNCVPSASELRKRSGRLDDDIGVAIGPCGELLHFRKGHHRIILAKQLGVEKISVKVHVVHARWLQEALGLCARELVFMINEIPKGQGGSLQETVQKHMETFSRPGMPSARLPRAKPAADTA